ncbi:MAG: right-handed parallel beta-helix repeat-containing protein [Phycisphaerales bacterium]|nr:MAG: right-handed parallel beta-helix repeat-containing protein [Phycisphaerales bacterium]
MISLFISGAYLGDPALARSWSPPQVIAGSSRMGIDIAIDADGNWHLVHDSVPDNFNIRYVSSTGAQEIVNPNSRGLVSSPSIDMGPNGDLHVAYRSYNTSVMYTNNLSGEWSTPRAIAGASRLGIDIAVDADGNWHLAHDSVPDNFNIRYVSSTGAQEIVNPNSRGIVSCPSIDIGPNGDLHVAYRSYNTSVMYTTLALGPKTFYVDADSTGVNDGSSWVDAFNYLQDALAAAESGDQIRVAEGVYGPDEDTAHPDGTGNRSATFQLKDGVAIYGGYAGFGEPDPDARDIALYETILSGDLDGDDGADFANNDENSYHVVTGSGTDATAVLDGFTVASGNATDAAGGGMHNSGSSPTVTNCTFSGNWAAFGGGMGNQDDANPTVTNCVFRANGAIWDGGGMSNDASSPTLTNCTFHENSASHGGGVVNYDSSPTFTNCLFSGNEANLAGGGMHSHGYERGCSPRLTNCTFAANSAPSGAALACDSDAGQCPSNLELTNCIAWDQGDEVRNNDGSTITITYSDVQGGWPGEDNIDIDPLFADTDYHLSPASPCIETGDNGAVPPGITTDLDGNPRIVDADGDDIAVVDMGAYEHAYIPPVAPVADAGGPYEGNVGDGITFDASKSRDADGEIVLHEWDWDFDGLYDYATRYAVYERTWEQEYSGMVRLRVTDNDGLTGTDTAELTIVFGEPKPVEECVRVSKWRIGYVPLGDTGQVLAAYKVTVTNLCLTSIYSPVWLVIEDITGPSKLVAPDGKTGDGKDYVDLSDLLGDGELETDEEITKRIYFDNPPNTLLHFEVSIWGRSPP